MTHTPGPWIVKGRTNPMIWHIDPTGDKHVAICDMFVANRDSNQMRDDACLIAESPNLLKAAEGLIEYRDHNTLNFQLEKADDFINEFRVAVAKVKGKT